MRSLFYKLLAVLAVSDVVFILSSGFFTVKQGRDSQEKLEGNGPVEPAASRAIEDKHVVLFY